MKATGLWIILVLALVAPAMAFDVYVGGSYLDYEKQFPFSSAYGVEVKGIQPIGAGFGVGLSAGYERADLRRDVFTRGRRCVYSDITDGSYTSVPLGILGTYTIDLGKASIMAEAGLQYHLMDYDIVNNTSFVCSKFECSKQNADYNAGNIWTATPALFLNIPAGDVISISIGGGYRWQLNAYQHDRFMEGPFGKLFLGIKI